MTAIENMTDEQIATALAAQQEPPTLDPTVAMQEAGRRMKKLRAILERKAVVDTSAKEQHGEIDAWHRQETERFDGEIARLKLELEPLVSMLVASEPMGRKSVSLVAGRAGYRQAPDSVVLEDPEAAKAAILAKGTPKAVKECVRTTWGERIDIPSIKRHFPQPDVLDGVRVIKGTNAFWYEPTGSGGEVDG